MVKNTYPLPFQKSEYFTDFKYAYKPIYCILVWIPKFRMRKNALIKDKSGINLHGETLRKQNILLLWCGILKIYLCT